MLKFDIILPSIRRDSLQGAVDSVIAQEYEHWNLYVVLDGCDRLGCDLAFSSDDKRVRRFASLNLHEDNGAWARHEGIAIGTSKWIAYIDDDDEFLPNHLTTLVELATLHPEANMLRTAGQQFKMGHKTPRSSKKVRKLGPVNSTDILTVGMVHTRKLYNKTQGWQPGTAHDKDLWNAMLVAGGIPAETDTITFLFKR